MTDEKMQKFEKTAERRVTNALKKIISIGRLANKNYYNYTEEHVQQILNVLTNEVEELREKFNKRKISTDVSFKFK